MISNQDLLFSMMPLSVTKMEKYPNTFEKIECFHQKRGWISQTAFLFEGDKPTSFM